MSEATIEAAKDVLEGALEDVEAAEGKLRTGIRFLEILEYQEHELLSLVEEEFDADDREVVQRMRDLGYLEE